MSDLISRQSALNEINHGVPVKGWEDSERVWELVNIFVNRIKQLPPAQPESNYDEWCTNCKEYDHENSCCPRWTKVIRQTRRELQDEFVMTAVDGTLWVTVDDVQKVGRVIVDEEKSKFCRQFYMDAQPEPCEDDPRADVYYLAEKIGIHQLYALVVQLRGEPEPCEDAVSRAEILRMIDCINDHHAITPYKSVGAVTEHLTRIASNLPPVTPKQRTGKWIPQDHNKRVGNISTCVYYPPICSKCGKVGIETYKYCPHCGAKMEGANNETD